MRTAFWKIYTIMALITCSHKNPMMLYITVMICITGVHTISNEEFIMLGTTQTDSPFLDDLTIQKKHKTGRKRKYCYPHFTDGELKYKLDGLTPKIVLDFCG